MTYLDTPPKWKDKKWGIYKVWRDPIYLFFTKIERSMRQRKYIPFFQLIKLDSSITVTPDLDYLTIRDNNRV